MDEQLSTAHTNCSFFPASSNPREPAGELRIRIELDAFELQQNHDFLLRQYRRARETYLNVVAVVLALGTFAAVAWFTFHRFPSWWIRVPAACVELGLSGAVLFYSSCFLDNWFCLRPAYRHVYHRRST